MTVHQLTLAEARRIAVRAQLLAEPRPADLLDAVRHLTLVQVEPTAAVAPSAEVVMWSRLGPSYRVGDLDDAVAAGTLVELQARLRPAGDIALYRAEMAVWPGAGELVEWQQDQRDWMLANDEGPLPSRELPDTTLVPWESSGWNNDRNVRMLLSLMVRRGEPAVVERLRGRWRLDTSYLDSDVVGRTVLLSPLDRLVYDRKRMADLFGFDYQLEMYKPAAKRRWGYWAMPILYGERLVGKLDATADRAAGVLRIHAVHEDEPFTAEMTEAVHAEIEDLARWLDLVPVHSDAE